MDLKTEIQYIKGVGPKRAAILKSELGVATAGDLLRLYPFRHIDRTTILNISDIFPDAAYVQIQARVVSCSLFGSGSQPIDPARANAAKRLSVIVEDNTGRIELVFFKGLKYTFQKLQPGTVWRFFGKPSEFNGRISIVHPEIDPPARDGENAAGVMTGVYPSTEKLKNAGFTGRMMNKIMSVALVECIDCVQESLPDSIISEHNLVPARYALQNIHFPKDAMTLSKASRRLKFEELFFLQLSLLKQKYIHSRADNGIVMKKVGENFNACYNALPYELTGAQKRVIKEIRSDLMSGRQMNRLLQGDVGSGKTMVAVLTALIAVGNGYQACIMAPTEVLARQHFDNVSKYLKPTTVKAALLTGSTKTSERKAIAEGLEDGSIGIIIGTHALLEDPVTFHNLGMAIVDEQHRFGVEQRSKLWSKGRGGVPPHVLVMTATPIPRTLAMTLYGDLDVSIIDEMPPGRKPVQTMQITENRRGALNRFIRDQIGLGRQAFIVYPMIYENEKMDYKNLEEGYEKTVEAFPLPEYKVAIVHGKQAPDVKDFNMSAFAAGRANILVSTTVIEVGVDVPNASVMVIESAERFGLSQLHQLRGRVGRGSDKSYCILVRGDKLSKESRKRLDLLCSTEDGFVLAEEDMKMRGPGDLEGTQQSGLPIELNIASLARDGMLLEEARACAGKVLEKDPDLSRPENAMLREELRKDKYKTKDFSKIS